MSISSSFYSKRYAIRLSVKLLMGVWLFSYMPVMAQTVNSRLDSPVLIANRIILIEGDQGAAVEELQRQLDRNGLFPGAIDGVYGPATTQAVRQYQRIRRLEVTGDADEDTLYELGVDIDRLPAGFSHPVHGAISGNSITPNSSAEDVSTLQAVLRSYGFDLATDGVYGSQTRQAVRTYERTAGLPVDGIADQETLIDMGFDPDGRLSNRSIGSQPGSIRSQPSSIGSQPSIRSRPDELGSITRSRNSRSSQGRYVAAIITNHSALGLVRRDFPSARAEDHRLGEYISIGRFNDAGDADDWADYASDLGYEARVIRD